MSGADDDDSHIIASVRRILGEDAARARPEPPGVGAAPSDDVFELSPDMLIESTGPEPASASPAVGWGTSRSVGRATAARKPQTGARDPEPPLDRVADEEAARMEAAPTPVPPEAAAEPDPAREPTSPLRPPDRGRRRADPPTVSGDAEVAAPGEERYTAARDAEGDAVYDGAMVEPRTADAAGAAFDSLRDTLRAQRDAVAAAAAGTIPALATSSHAGGPTIEQMIREELRPLLKGWLDARLPDLVDRAVRAEIARIVGRGDG